MQLPRSTLAEIEAKRLEPLSTSERSARAARSSARRAKVPAPPGTRLPGLAEPLVAAKAVVALLIRPG